MNNDLIEELLIDWEVARQAGKVLTAEELCLGKPELVDQVEQRIAQLLQTSWMMEDSDSQPPTADVETEPTRSSQVGIREFIDRVSSNELLNETQTKERLDESYVQQFADAEDLSNALVADNVLTRYQSDALLGYELGPLRLDRYLIIEAIGAGGMGVIYRALHQSMNRYVAIKTLPAQSFSTDRMARFKREMQAAAKLDHPNIVTAYDAHEANGIHFLVMELIEGDDLAKIIRAQGPLDYPDACLLCAQVASALEAAHDVGIIHRDVKPSNILLDAKGNAKLLDMGLARFKQESFEQTFTSSELSQFGMPMGTVAYMSPEQAINASDAGAATDVYALGCTLYQMITGKPPFDAPSPIQVIVDHREKPVDVQTLQENFQVPELLTSHLQRMLAKKPTDRFSSMAEVRSALLPFADPEHRPISGAAALVRQRKTLAKTGQRSNGRIWGLFSAGLLLLCATLVFGWMTFGGWGTAASGVEDQTDVVKWAINAEAYLTIESDLGVQEIYSHKSIPEGAYQLTGISALDFFGDPVPMKLFSPTIPLTSISLTDTPVTDEVLKAISKHPKLQEVNFYDCQVDCKDKSWEQLTNIQQLGIENCAIYGETLASLGQLKNLASLSVADNHLKDLDLDPLSGLGQLTSLDLSRNPITARSAIALAKQLPQLVQLRINYIKLKTEDAKTLQELPNLEQLSISDSATGDAAIGCIAEIKGLLELTISGTKVTDAAIAKLATLDSLLFLDLDDTSLTDNAVQELIKFPELAYLSLNGTEISDASADHWEKFKSLTDLELNDTAITDQTLRQLSKLPLVSLSILGCDVSESAANKFLAKNPDCDLYLEE